MCLGYDIFLIKCDVLFCKEHKKNYKKILRCIASREGRGKKKDTQTHMKATTKAKHSPKKCRNLNGKKFMLAHPALNG